MKKQTIVEGNIIHHIHHAEGKGEDYRREISLTGSMATVTISSNNPKETLSVLCNRALDLFKRVKEVDRHE